MKPARVPLQLEEPMTDPQHVRPNEARSGVKLGVMRYVLGISLAAVIVAFLVAYVLF